MHFMRKLGEIGVYECVWHINIDAVYTPTIIYILIILNISDSETITNEDAPNNPSKQSCSYNNNSDMHL